MFSRIFIRVKLFDNKVQLYSKERTILNIRRCFHWVDNDDENGGVSILQVKKALKAGYFSHIDGHACITVDCPICGVTKRKDQPKVFINKTTGDRRV